MQQKARSFQSFLFLCVMSLGILSCRQSTTTPSTHKLSTTHKVVLGQHTQTPKLRTEVRTVEPKVRTEVRTLKRAEPRSIAKVKQVPQREVSRPQPRVEPLTRVAPVRWYRPKYRERRFRAQKLALYFSVPLLSSRILANC